MTDTAAARASGEEFLHLLDKLDPLHGVGVNQARRVVTALLEALRPFTEVARFAEGDTRPKVTTELTASPMTRDGTPGPWQVEREDSKTTSGEPVVTWWVWRAPSHYLAQLDTEAEALAVRDALNGAE